MNAAAPHPLDPLSPAELRHGAAIIKKHADEAYAVGGDAPRLWYKFVTLREPPKKELVAYLLAARSAASSTVVAPARRANALMQIRTAQRSVFVEYELSLSDATVTSTRELGPEEHPGMDAEEVILAEEKLFANAEFQEAIRSLRLPEGATVVADTWTYGSDTTEERPRLIPFMLYYRLGDNADFNHYAYPIPLIPSIRTTDWSLYSLDWTPIHGGEDTRTIKDLPEGEVYPWAQHRQHEYDESLRADIQERQDLKPLRVVQSEGPSFKVTGRLVEWQKWSFRVGFNYREGLTLHDVTYDGRDTFHRLSVSDMTVPYGDPRAPFHRKQAFDLGDAGAGNTANELNLGCDCLGLIHYFDSDAITSDGNVLKQNNVVCLHEQDEGIGMKHTNYRTNRPTVVRSRALVVQQIITIANYEYVFAWKFDMMAAVHLETRATGILSTSAILDGETSPYGPVVNPGVLAANHQHLFSVRIDPAIGALGEGNSVVQEEAVPMPFDAQSPPANNPHGVGFTIAKKTFATSGWADAAPEKNRVFKIINPSRANPVSKRPIGYKLVPAPSQLMLAHPDSIAYKRAEFGGHHLWITKHKDEELFSGGVYTNQSNGNANGILSWVARNDPVEDDDLVVWTTFGLTHAVRVEDFPVMPSEVHEISFKSADFFTGAPNLDAPRSKQTFNRSVAAPLPGHGLQGSAEVEEKAAAAAASCCRK